MSLAAMAGALRFYLCTAWWRNVCFRDIAPPAHHRVLRSIAPAIVSSCASYLVFAALPSWELPNWHFPQYRLDNIDDFALAILVWNYRSGSRVDFHEYFSWMRSPICSNSRTHLCVNNYCRIGIGSFAVILPFSLFWTPTS